MILKCLSRFFSGDQTMNNLSAAAEPWVQPMGITDANYHPPDPEGCRTYRNQVINLNSPARCRKLA
jgi:hypothetical protein